MRIFAEAQRLDGFDACEMLRKAFPQLLFATSQGIVGEHKTPFSLAMDFLTPLFGLRESAFHSALKDCRAESVIVTAFIRYFAAFNVVINNDDD